MAKFKYKVWVSRRIDAEYNDVTEWCVSNYRTGEIVSRHEDHGDAHRAAQRYIAEDAAWA